MSAVVRLNMLDWEEARAVARPLRYQVFCVEQGVPVEIEWDDWDESSSHCVARDADGTVVGTGRLLPDGHIGRMAVERARRGRGVGGAILEALVEHARQRGLEEVVLDAQTQALAFYTAHGFQVVGTEFMVAGIVHMTMRRPLGRTP